MWPPRETDAEGDEQIKEAEMSKQVIAVSGHRPNKLGGYDRENPTRDLIVQKLEEVLLGLHEKAPEGIIVVTGMSMGVDLWTCRVCHTHNIPYVAAVPFEGQEVKWSQAVQEEYRQAIGFASLVKFVSDPGYEARKMLIRNEWMVEKATQVLVVWTGERSGTGHTAFTAHKVGKPLIRMKPEDATLHRVVSVREDWTLGEEQ